MRFNRFAAFIAFCAAAFAVVVTFLRRVAGQTKALDEAEERAADAETVVEEKRADLAALDKAAEAAHLAVEHRLDELDKHLARERERDSVDVANDIIKGD